MLRQYDFFITGTDTYVGKTHIACALLRQFSQQGTSTIGMKPVVTGIENGKYSDVENLLTASTVKAPRAWINPYQFPIPTAPHIAAYQAGMQISIPVIQQALGELQGLADSVIVEGAGGLCVPINAQDTLLDLIDALHLPVVLVVGIRLGCINHALLSVLALKNTGLTLAGWVANILDPTLPNLADTIDTLKQRIPAPCWAEVDWGGEIPLLRIPIADG